MKKILLSVLASSVMVYASAVPSNEALMQKALGLYQENKFDKAYPLFSTLFESISDDPKINFHLGRCALELRKYDEALTAFERVLMIDPNHYRSRLELARLYFEEKSWEQAEEEFKILLEAPLPDNVKINIKNYMSAIKEAKNPQTIYIALIYGWGYDTNINSGIGADKVYMANNSFVNGLNPISDSFHTVTGALSYRKGFEIRDNFYQMHTATLYTQSYTRNSASNVIFGGVNLGIGYTQDRWDILTSLGVDTLKLGSKNIQYDVLLSQRLNYSYSQVLQYNLQVALKTKKMRQVNDKGQDSRSVELNGGVTRNFGPYGYINFGATFSDEDRLRDPNILDAMANLSAQTKGIRIDYGVSLRGFDVNLGWGQSRVKYKDADVLDNYSKKKDTVTSGNIGIAKKITSQFTLGLSNTYIHNDSSLIRSSYNKNTTLMNLNLSF